MHKSLSLLILFFLSIFCLKAQEPTTGKKILLQISDAEKEAIANATVELLRSKDSGLLKIQMSDSLGTVSFTDIEDGNYFFRISRVSFQTVLTSIIVDDNLSLQYIVLQRVEGVLQEVTVSSKKPFIELLPDKTIINIEAGITNVGTTAMEALEKLPGVSIDKNGNISLKGRPGVMIMIDGKPTYLGSAELATLLNGMSASQISQIELMDQPSAKYDAAGNSGIINIKTKKNKQAGFNGSFSTAFGQGVYPKNNNNLQLNYRTGKINLFANYSMNINKGFTRLYALRSYLENNGQIASLLEQPSYIKRKGTTHSLRTGIDYFLNAKTTIGFIFNGVSLTRSSNGSNQAIWMDAHRVTDSLIHTSSNNKSYWDNGGINFNFRHAFSANREVTADVDMIGYKIRGDQFFENRLINPGTYLEASRANLPSDINIISAKADYSSQAKDIKWEGGWKTSHITTDNLAAYEFLDGNTWKVDLGKSNHFLYEENIHAVYGNAQTKIKKWSLQAGLRYELTNYNATQLGNVAREDSSFSRSYNSLFPSAFVSYNANDNNSFTLSAGRRIDRPAFQKLNPFLFIINKYTYQQGNPFYRPQYTWNFEASHLFKDVLITSVRYSRTNDYFSQIFFSDTSGTVIYTEGNLGMLHNIGASMSVQMAPAKWWSLSAQAGFNHKKMEGVLWKDYKADITQFNFNINNQFRFQKGWSGELTGFYNSRSQHDIQEIVDPAGQVSLGISKAILKNKGTLKLAVRDVFYTQAMKGITYFEDAVEIFSVTGDSRVATISFSYRFGKASKATKRSGGAAGEETQRVGNG